MHETVVIRDKMQIEFEREGSFIYIAPAPLKLISFNQNDV